MTTGSLVNNLMGSSKSTQPTVGMGATILMWSDRHAATIVDVPSPKTVIVQEDRAERIDQNGMSDAQEYEFREDKNGRMSIYTLRKNGAWVRKGASMKNGERLMIGFRSHYYDYSF